MTKQTSPFRKEVSAGGWANDQLRHAYLLIEKVANEWHPEDAAGECLRRALDEIETADCEIEKAWRS